MLERDWIPSPLRYRHSTPSTEFSGQPGKGMTFQVLNSAVETANALSHLRNLCNNVMNVSELPYT